MHFFLTSYYSLLTSNGHLRLPFFLFADQALQAKASPPATSSSSDATAGRVAIDDRESVGAVEGAEAGIDAGADDIDDR